MAYCDLQLVDSLGKPFQTSLMAVREHRSPTVQRHARIAMAHNAQRRA